MRQTLITTASTVLLGTAFTATAGHAQAPLAVCETQQSLEQVLGSDGDIMPDDCRDMRISQLASDGITICLLDLAQTGGGLIDDLRAVAVSQEWWVDCAALSQQASPVE